MSDNDLFVDEAEHEAVAVSDFEKSPWKILIVDDQSEVHEVTKLALLNFSFEERPLKFLHAYSAAEAKSLLLDQDDIAMVLLDVVMESDDSGLALAQWIREDLLNKFIRIILRTGQPGLAAEKEVIQNYDIDDYKEKTELTASKLYTVVYSSLRAYRDIVAIDVNRRGLEIIAKASARLLEIKSTEEFAKEALSHFISLLHVGQEQDNTDQDALVAVQRGRNIRIVAGQGVFEGKESKILDGLLDETQIGKIEKVLNRQINMWDDTSFIATFKTSRGKKNLFYVPSISTVESLDHQLIDLFCKNIGTAYENLYLMQDLKAAEWNVVHRLVMSGDHVEIEGVGRAKRMREIAEFLARRIGFPQNEIDLLNSAAPLHDIGNLNIPDSVLAKPGPLTDEELQVVRSHTTTGFDLLSACEDEALQAAALIARDHHEWWNGSGYPEGKSGEQIYKLARVASIADVFEALSRDLPYRKAWDLEKIRGYFRDQRAKQFDPEFVDSFLANLDDMLVLIPDIFE